MSTLQLGREYFCMNNSEREINRQQWLFRLEQYRSSGMTQEEWCRENGISRSSLRYWLKREKTDPANCTQWLKVTVDNNPSVGKINETEPPAADALPSEQISISCDGVTVTVPFRTGILGMQQIISILKTS